MDALSPEAFVFGRREGLLLGVHVAMLTTGLAHYSWYLLMLLVAKVFLVNMRRVGIPRHVQLIIFFGIAWFGALVVPVVHSCTNTAQARAFFVEKICFLNVQSGFIWLINKTKLFGFTLYGWSFLLGPDIVRKVRERSRELGGMPPFLGWFTMVIFYTTLLVTPEVWKPLVIRLAGPVSTHKEIIRAFLDLGLLILPLLCSIACFPESWHMETIARNCLGSYVSSCFFCEYCADVGPDGVLSNMWRSVSVTCGGGDVGAVMQMIGIFCFVIFWVFVVGPATQYALLIPVRLWDLQDPSATQRLSPQSRK